MSLRIGTLNTQLRSLAMEALADIDPFAESDAPQRAQLLASRIINSGYDYDVIVLNEVFHEEAREILVKALQGKYPFVIAKVGGGSSSPPDIAVLDDGDLIDVNLEDSGLMVFSRLQFEEVVPGKVAVFAPFKEAAFPDDMAAKGALYVLVGDALNFKERAIGIVVTHLQADAEPGIRKAQLQQIQELIEKVDISSDLFVLGDLNIDGGPDDPQEWASHFAQDGSFFSTVLHDVWAKDQVPSDPGFTHGHSRYDYILHRGPLVPQHLTIAYNLLNPKLPAASDHYGINADWNFFRPLCTPLAALAAQFGADSRFSHSGNLERGQMAWFRFDEQGSYAFRTFLDDDVRLEVYTASNLSVPMAPYKGETSPAGKDSVAQRYLLPEAPFFVRVFLADRRASGKYGFEAIRHRGVFPGDAIELIPNLPTHGEISAGKPFNADSLVDPVDTGDAVWYSIHTEQADSGAPQSLRFFVESAGASVFSLILLDADFNLLQQAGPGPVVVEMTREQVTATRFFLLVKRHDPKFKVSQFTVGWDTNLTVVHGLNAGLPGVELRLSCADETNPEVGSDDIEVRVHADGQLLSVIANGQIGDFDEGDVRSLEPFLGPIRYVSEVRFDIVELDDVSANDVGTLTVPTLQPFETHKTGEQLDASFEGGTYRLYYNRSRWLP